MKQDWNRFWKASTAGDLARTSHSKRRMMAILRRHFVAGTSALDAGCGSGWFTARFLEAGLASTALDYSEQALAIARELSDGKAQYVADDLLDPALPGRLGRRFRLIFTDGLFEHFTPADQDRIFENFRALLEPGGVIATFVPNLLSPWQIIRPFLMPGIKEKPFLDRDLRRLTRNVRELERGGLNVLPITLSPERALGSTFGMIRYSICTDDRGAAA